MNKMLYRIIGKFNIPPREVPAHPDFTLGGKIPVTKWYIDSRFEFRNSHSLLTGEKASFDEQLNEYLEATGKRIHINYGGLCSYFYQALDKYSIRGKDVVVMGSINPWVEAICLYYGCRHCTVMEYNIPKCAHPKLKYIKPTRFRGVEQFDFGVSLSSFEHDGLGRYGDPLNPSADLEAMKSMKKLLKKDGILFLSVPVGPDELVWNAHRIYGNIRLPLLLDGWKTLEVFDGNQTIHEPLRVLQNI